MIFGIFWGANVLLLAPYTAQAGILSFLESLFRGSKTEMESAIVVPAVVASGNQDELILLDAPTNSNISYPKGGAALTFVENSALMSVVGPLGSIADIEEPKSDAISIYVVREGDTLSGIARMFNVTVNTILWANDIRSARQIRPGDTLVILPVTGIKYTVRKGDTLKSISERFKGDANEILAFNALEPDAVLAVGLEIIIPDGEVAPLATRAPSRIAGGALGSLNTVGYFMRPAVGKKTQGVHGYNGIDIGASCGSPIYASAAGSVIIARGYGWNGGYGQYMVISHLNGTQTLYAHNSSVLVNQGQYVGQGQTIGTVGSTGRSTGCHLHFEVRGAKNPF